VNLHLVIIAAYAVALVGVGFYVSRRVRTSSDFFVAGRKLSPRLLFATLLAANIGGGSTVGAAGLGYAYGLSAWWWVGSAGLGQLILSVTVGPRIWRLAKVNGFFTVGDFLDRRYSRAVRGTIAVLLWLGSLSILAGQLIGIAWILNVVTGAPKAVGCLVGGLCVTLYFSAGGLLSSVWVNVVQLTVKLAGLGLALPVALGAVGGWGGISRAASHGCSQDYLSITGLGTSGILGYLVLLVPPFIVSPGLLQKIYGARDEAAVRHGTAANGAVLLVYSFVPVLLGMAASAAVPGFENREMAMPAVLMHLLPVWIGALALAAIFSAEVNAADAVLFMLATSLSEDLYKSYIHPEATGKRLLRVGRFSSVVAGLLGVGLAIQLPTIISALSIFYGLVTVSLFVPVVAGLYLQRPGPATALVAIAAAVSTTAGLHLTTGGASLWGVSPIPAGLSISVVVFLIGSIARKRRAAPRELSQ
jgi:SSS family solute:Na+ symporter